MPKTVSKPYNNGRWTEARFKAFIKSGLRSLTSRWGPKYIVKKEARVARGKYTCAGYKRKPHVVTASVLVKGRRINNVEINHIVPVVPSSGFDSWDGIIKRMFCEKDGFEVLCRECHQRHTKDLRNKE